MLQSMSVDPYRNNLQAKISELADDNLPQIDDESLILAIRFAPL